MSRCLPICGLLLGLVILVPGASAQDGAADPLLAQSDQLREAGQCEASLALLGQVSEISDPSRAGRQGLCEASLGQGAEASAHLAEALRSPDDAWVVANRDALIAALVASQSADAPPAPTPTSEAAEPAEPAATESSVYSLPADFGDQITRRPGEDFAIPRRGDLTFPRRLSVRLGAAGGVSIFAESSEGDGVYQDPVALRSFVSGWFEGYVDVLWEFEDHWVLQAGLSVGGKVGLSDTEAVDDSYWIVSNDRILRAVAFGGVRFLPGTRRVFVGLGANLGLISIERSTSWPGCTLPVGCPDGTTNRPAVQGYMDIGGLLGSDRNADFFLRVAAGYPAFITTLNISVPLMAMELDR